tara:strand:- start:51 stop:515 length:465 start_codon:yes stop_codon:yes gene_type:complete
MKNFKNIIFLFVFILVNSCGYTPLKNSEKINFYINDLNFTGDRIINNYIFGKLKKYQNPRENLNRYNIDVLSTYEKYVVNKNDKGDPKNYKIKIITNIKVTSEGSDVVNKIFRRNASLSAKNKKIEEKESEKQLKKDLANLITEDIIFFLITNN